MPEVRNIWLCFCVLTVAGNNEHPSVKGEVLGTRDSDIDAAHISRYGEGYMVDSKSLAQFTTLHPSEQLNPSSNESMRNKSRQSDALPTAAKKLKDKTLKVSSDKVHNGGRKGPMSGATNQEGSSLPVSILIPFPIIPVQGQGNAMSVPAQGGPKRQKKKKKVSKSESDRNKRYGSKEQSNKQSSIVNKHLLQLTNRQENATADVPSGNVSVERLKRDTTHGMEDNVLTDEERDLRDKWLHPREEDLIPGAENHYYDPRDLAYIEESQRNLEKHVRDVMPFLQKYKRTLYGDDHTYDELQFRLRQARGVDGRLRNSKLKLLA